MSDVTPLTREEREKLGRRYADARAQSRVVLMPSSDALLERALATLDAIEADMRWLAKKYTAAPMTRSGQEWYSVVDIPESDWNEHVAPWVEPA